MDDAEVVNSWKFHMETNAGFWKGLPVEPVSTLLIARSHPAFYCPIGRRRWTCQPIGRGLYSICKALPLFTQNVAARLQPAVDFIEPTSFPCWRILQKLTWVVLHFIHLVLNLSLSSKRWRWCETGAPTSAVKVLSASGALLQKNQGGRNPRLFRAARSF